MSLPPIAILLGTTKGAFLVAGDEERLGWAVRGPFCNAIMGYWVGEKFAKAGYTSEGVRLVLGRAFGELVLHRVEANVVPTNAASIALAKGVGFREEGYSPRYLEIAGAWQDHVRFAMTVEDWRELGGDQPK